MATPTLSVAYDKATYAPGAQITATVTYSDPDTKTTSEVWQATNANGEQATITVDRHVVDAVTIVPPAGFTQVPGSDTGASVKFTATA
jgi:hypothetical protein